MAVGGDAVVDCGEVGQGVVVTWHDVVDRVCTFASAEIADSLVAPEDYLPPRRPVGG